MAAIPKTHLHDLSAPHPRMSLCGEYHPARMVDNLTETECKRCLSQHEFRMKNRPAYREAVEALTQPGETRQ